ncbi:hypothetical protein H7I41_05055 [Mycobacterium manitobense]|uniref:Uncharacterized protein n=1 Tax=[Mycobacterium] manitobense TaxID=190147 RepID=A0A9X2YLF5_9MYCO|nr:hypothetical protein [[Mycobacterium] manitobense]MCV7169294.1 hypothetical protein [[Mycobacterium] manitobense]
MTDGERVFWRGGRCTVWVGLDAAGALVFSGHDLAYLGEPGRTYEYWITVAPERFPDLRRALHAGPHADVVDLVCSRVDAIMAGGERTWLDDHGIDYAFTCY